MHRLLFYTSLLLLWAQYASAQTETIGYTQYSINQGISNNTIRDIYQDHRGFLWLATGDGLNRFDGYTFTTYNHDSFDSTSISDVLLYAVFEDKKQRMWIGTNQGGLSLFDTDTEKFINYKHNENDASSLAVNTINTIFEDSKGRLWIGTREGGLHLFNPDTGKFTRYQSSPSDNTTLSQNDIRAIEEAPGGQLWVATYWYGFNKFDPETGKCVRYVNIPNDTNSLSYNKILDIETDRRGMLWIATEGGGINIYDPLTNQFDVIKNENNKSDNIPSNVVFRLLSDNVGNMWVGTTGGLAIFSEQTHQKVNLLPQSATQFLQNTAILSIFRDKTGIFWVGTESEGLIKIDLRPKAFKHYYNKNNKPAHWGTNTIRSINQDHQGFLWIGVIDGGLTAVNQNTGKIIHHVHKPGSPGTIPNYNVAAMMLDSHNNLWIGFWGGGLTINKIDQGLLTYVTYNWYDDKNPKSLRDNIVQAIYEDDYGRVWIGTGIGLDLYESKTGTFRHFENNPNDGKSLSNNSIQSNCILQDSQGKLLIGTWGGINRMIATSTDSANIDVWGFEHYYHQTGDTNTLTSNRIISMCKDNNGQIWIGTYGDGLNKMVINRSAKGTDSIIFEHFTTKHGLPNNVIYAIQCDNSGRLWLSTNNGLSCFDPANNTFVNFDQDDGLQSNQFYWGASYKNKRSGELFFGGLNGFNAFFPDRIQRDTLLPEVVLTSFKILNREVPIGTKGSPLTKHISRTNKIELTYEDKVVSFEFAALHFAAPHNNQYAYKLEGFDKTWVYTDANKRFVTYTNLPARTYTLRVKASNSDGIWNENGVALTIVVHPPVWLTWWFRLLLVVIITASAITFYLIRINAIRRQNKILEQRVVLRTREIAKQKEEIEFKNHDLEQKNEEIAQQTEMLVQTNELLQLQKEKIERQNENIKSSIKYALTIQQAMLPDDGMLSQWFDYFVLYRPKDIVSGDFYWVHNLPKQRWPLFVAVVDCTGHGVPGAFLSMIGNRLLNEIVSQRQITEPHVILELLDAEIKDTLRQETSHNDDGMDICLCRITPRDDKFSVSFAGARRPLFYSNTDGNISMLQGTRRAIGGNRGRSRDSYTSEELLLDNGSMIYLTSDGVVEQNAPDRNRFGTERLVAALSKMQFMSIEQQHLYIEKTMLDYQDTSFQRDDMTLLGIRLQHKQS